MNIASILQNADKNNSGYISLDEWISFWTATFNSGVSEFDIEKQLSLLESNGFNYNMGYQVRNNFNAIPSTSYTSVPSTTYTTTTYTTTSTIPSTNFNANVIPTTTTYTYPNTMNYNANVIPSTNFNANPNNMNINNNFNANQRGFY